MTSYILVWEGSCEPAVNTEQVAVPDGKVVYMTRAPQINNTSVTVTNCTQDTNYAMAAGGVGNSMVIDVSNNDTLCFTGRSNNTANSVMIDVIDPR